MNWYLDVLKKYAVFDGRARRKEYWMYTLFNTIIYIAVAILGFLLGAGDTLIWIYALAVLLPGLGVTIRRLHDTDRSGWWVLISLVPFIGSIVLLVFLVLDGSPGQNQYGTNPKAAAFA